MAAGLNKWAIALAIQSRFEAGMSKYEAVLAMYTIRTLHPDYLGGSYVMPDPLSLWICRLQSQLHCFVNDQEYDRQADDENWMNVWMSLRTPEMLVAKQGAEDLLASIGEAHGLQQVPTSRSTAGGDGPDTRDD